LTSFEEDQTVQKKIKNKKNKKGAQIQKDLGQPKQLNRAALHRCLLLFRRRSPFSDIIPLEIADEGLDSVVFGEKTTVQRQFRRPLLPLYLLPQRRPTVSSSPFSPCTGLSTLQEVPQPTHNKKNYYVKKKNQAPKDQNKQKHKQNQKKKKKTNRGNSSAAATEI